MKKTLVSILCAPVLIGLSSATVTLDFSQPGDVFKDIANSSGVVTNGLAWGVVIDTQGNNFAEPFLSSVGLMAEDGADFGNGYIFYNPLNQDGTHVTFTSGLPGGGAGAIDFNVFDVYGDSNPVSAGQQFAVIWFGESSVQNGSSLPVGTSYGIATSGTATLPSDTQSESYVGAFADGVKSANLQFVPEPSTFLLSFIGLAGLLRRRR